jgi:hypothetical protein
MSKLLWNLLKVAPAAVVGASVIAIGSANAAPEKADAAFTLPNKNLVAQAAPSNETTSPSVDSLRENQNGNYLDGQINENGNQGGSMDQVTSVTELKDVAPTEWAYEALRSLVERYGCIVGYPDLTYRGNRALTRWEFAAGLNACLNTMERLIQENVAVLKEDIETLKRLSQEFEAELAALGGRVDNLEGRVAFLEDHQFSTTTKLRGEVIFNVADTFGDFADNVDDPFDNLSDEERDALEAQGIAFDEDDPTQTVFQDRVRLNFETSFFGEDLLRTRLQAGNFSGGNRFDNGVTGTNMTRLAYDDGEGNDVEIDDLWYRAPIGPVTAWVGASGLNLDDVFSTANPYLSDSGTGSITRLGRYNNMVNRGPSGTGLGLKFDINDAFAISAAYLAEQNDASDPTQGSGFLNGSYSAGAQLGFKPSENIELAATYVHTYRSAAVRDDEGVIDENTTLFGGITGLDAETPFGPDVATSAERFGLSASWQITERIHIGAWGGYAIASAQDAIVDAIASDVDIWTWNANLSFLDLGKEGSVLSFSGGLPPKGEFADGNVGTRIDDASYLIQAQYRYPITDNISITPGAYVLLNPDNNDANDAIWVGVLRTTFKF